MDSQTWAQRFDRSNDFMYQALAESWREEAWAMSLGFRDADEYHQAAQEEAEQGAWCDAMFEGNAE